LSFQKTRSSNPIGYDTGRDEGGKAWRRRPQHPDHALGKGFLPSYLQTINLETTMKTKANRTSFIVLLATTGIRVSAQVMLSGTNYTQNFDTLASGLPTGWSVRTNATAGSPGSDAGFTTNVTSWGTATGQFANYASTTSNNGTNFLGSEASTVQSGCTNRALAVRQVASGGFDPGAAFVLQLGNTTNRWNFQLALDFLTLYVKDRATVWTVDYAVGGSPTTFTPVGTFTDPRVFGKVTRTFSFGTALDNQSGPVWIRIAALSVSTPTNGVRNTFGIDNFSLSWEAGEIGSVTAIPLQIQLAGPQVVLTWSNPNFALQAASDCSGGFTNVPEASSPYTNSILEPQKLFRLKAN